MCLFVFVKVKHSKYIDNIEKNSLATGIADMVGNKGGLFIAFTF